MKRAAILIFLLLVGCTRAYQSSFTDPGYQTHQFKSVLVFASNMELRGRQLVESSMVRRFQAYGVTAYQAMELLPPTRQYSIEQINSVLAKHQIESVLILTLADQEISTNYVPQISNSTTTGTITTYGNTAFLNSSTQTSSGGFYVSKPRAYYNAQLLDASNFEKAWIYSGELAGNAFANFDKLSVKAGAIVVKRLIIEGLYPRK